MQMSKLAAVSIHHKRHGQLKGQQFDLKYLYELQFSKRRWEFATIVTYKGTKMIIIFDIWNDIRLLDDYFDDITFIWYDIQ